MRDINENKNQSLWIPVNSLYQKQVWNYLSHFVNQPHELLNKRIEEYNQSFRSRFDFILGKPLEIEATEYALEKKMK